jgi:hypothetical protein
MRELLSEALAAGRGVATDRAGAKFRRRRSVAEVRRVLLAVLRRLPAGLTVGEIVAALARAEREGGAP